MKQQLKAVSIALSAVFALGSGAAMADSAYGYDGTAPITGVSTAQTEVDIDVLVPKVIMLRVGLPGTGDANEDKVKIKGSVAGMVDGSHAFLGTFPGAPAFTVTGSGGFLGGAKTQAWAWTNSSAGGKVTCNTVGSGAAIKGDINVTSATISGGGLAHPGSTTACAAASNTPFAKHVVASSTWQYDMTPAAMGLLDAGEYHLDVYYTATSL
jgi:hypothetical protein